MGGRIVSDGLVGSRGIGIVGQRMRTGMFLKGFRWKKGRRGIRGTRRLAEIEWSMWRRRAGYPGISTLGSRMRRNMDTLEDARDVTPGTRDCLARPIQRRVGKGLGN